MKKIRRIAGNPILGSAVLFSLLFAGCSGDNYINRDNSEMAVSSFTTASKSYDLTGPQIFKDLFFYRDHFQKRKVKYRLFIFGFVFHFLIWIVHGLPSFWISMTAGLVLYLLDYKISIKDNLILCKKAFSSIFKYDNFQRTFESK